MKATFLALIVALWCPVFVIIMKIYVVSCKFVSSSMPFVISSNYAEVIMS